MHPDGTLYSKADLERL